MVMKILLSKFLKNGLSNICPFMKKKSSSLWRNRWRLIMKVTQRRSRLSFATALALDWLWRADVLWADAIPVEVKSPSMSVRHERMPTTAIFRRGDIEIFLTF